MRKFYAQRALFGIKRPAFTWGHGDGASPHIRRRCCECAQVLRGAHGGSGPATAGVWGRHQPPHSKTSALFSKIISAGFMPARASLGMQHPMLPGAWGEQPHKAKTPYESILASFSKRNRLCFIKQFPLDFMPVRAEFGIKRPAFTWGCGDGVSPRRCVRKSSFWAA